MGDGRGSEFWFAPVTPATIADLERFSGAYGKFRYCSCLRWRLRSSQFRDAPDRPGQLAGLVTDSRPVGVLAYRDGEPVGWCSVAPRESYAAISVSTTIPSLPGTGVWAVTCFFLAPGERRQGLRPQLLAAACDYASAQGAEIIEAYPWPGGASYRYMGTRALYADAGFTDVRGPAGLRPVMRYHVPR
jgi:GNAT superfamily N-acetyltransferase